MRTGPNVPPPGDDRELKRALRAAVTPPFDAVDWDGLHERIMSEARQKGSRAPRGTYGWVTRWSARGIPLTAGSLAAAATVILLLLPSRMAPVTEMPSPGAWPTAEEMFSSLPDETRLLLNAGADVESMITALMVHGRDGGGS